MKKFIFVGVFFLGWLSFMAISHSKSGGCAMPSAATLANTQNFTAMTTPNSSSLTLVCGGGGGGYIPTPTPTPVPTPSPIHSYLQSLYFDTNQENLLPLPGIADDIRLAMNTWKNLLGSCSSTILSNLVQQNGAVADGKNRVLFLSPLSIEQDYGISTNDFADDHIAAFTYFTSGPGGPMNPTLDPTSRFDIVFNMHPNNSFLPANWYCQGSNNCATETNLAGYHLVFTIVLHELGHAMGLPDYVNVPGGTNEFYSVMNVDQMMIPGVWALNLGVPTAFDVQNVKTNLGCNP